MLGKGSPVPSPMNSRRRMNQSPSPATRRPTNLLIPKRSRSLDPIDKTEAGQDKAEVGQEVQCTRSTDDLLSPIAETIDSGFSDFTSTREGVSDASREATPDLLSDTDTTDSSIVRELVTSRIPLGKRGSFNSDENQHSKFRTLSEETIIATPSTPLESPSKRSARRSRKDMAECRSSASDTVDSIVFDDVFHDSLESPVTPTRSKSISKFFSKVKNLVNKTPSQ